MEGADAGYQGLFAALGVIQWCLLIAVIVWIAMVTYEMVVRRRHNLTRAESASANKDLDLDFLKKDEAARQKALDAADDYAAELAAGEAAMSAQPQNVSRLRRLFSVASAFMAVLTLIGVSVGTIVRLEKAGDMLRDAGFQQFTQIVDQYPVGTYLSVLVIGYHAIAFFVFEKWKGENQ